MMGDLGGIPIAPLAELGIKIVDYFRSKRQQKDAIENIDRGWVGERISQPLVDMYGALVKVDTITEIYSDLLQTTDGNFRDILIQNRSKDFLIQSQQNLQVFWDNVDKLEKTNPGGSEVMESVKGNACASKDQFATDLKQKLEYFLSIGQSGARPTSMDIRDVIVAFHNFTNCYKTGVSAAIEDLAHAGRKTN